MLAFRSASLLAALFASSALVYACVGDDPNLSEPAPDAGTTTPGADSGLPPPGSDGGGETDSGNGGACDGGITCGGVCVDASSDPKNCGRCAHDCGTGECKAGVCQAKLIAGQADAGMLTTSITTDQSDDNPQGPAQLVFWSVTGAGGGVFQNNVTGGNTVNLATGPAAALTNVAVHGANVLWFARNFGGSPQPVLRSQVSVAGSQTNFGIMNCPFIQSITFDPVTQAVVGSYSASATTHGAFRCMGNGATCTTLITYTGQPGGNVARDATHLYYPAPDEGIIFRTALTGGNSSTYVMGQATPTAIRIDGTSVYWANNGTKTIQRGNLVAAGTPKQLASTANTVDAIAADAVNVYWTESVTGTVNYAPITGAGPNTPYVTLGSTPVPMRMVRDTGFLYFTHNGAIYRVALP